jgi:hypothetical protein
MSSFLQIGVVVADVHQYVSDVIMGVDEEERENMRAFADFIEDWCQSNQTSLEENCFYPLVTSFGAYDLNKLYADLLKERSVLSALWVIFLRVHRMGITDETGFKYRTLAEFLTEYNGDFDHADLAEQMRLFYTANWMAMVLKMLPAKRNKGYFLHVIPKLVEGFNVKYVTGSGQSRPTADRVRIFEHEGNVKKVTRKKPERQTSNSSVTSYTSVTSTSSVSSYSGVDSVERFSREMNGHEGLFNRNTRSLSSAGREISSRSFSGTASRELSGDPMDFDDKMASI